MRFKTGEKVEVMNNKEVKTFTTGDIVEVFHGRSWKTAVILNVLGGTKESKKDKIRYKISTFKNQYLVKLLGCSKELAIGRSNIRTRQTRHDVNWVPMEKIPQVAEEVIVSKPLTSNCSQKMNFHVRKFSSRAKYQPIEDSGNTQYDAAQRESVIISSRSLKRMSPYVSSVAEANNGRVKKFRSAEKEGQMQRVAADRLLGKVHAESLGEKYMHASYNIISNGYNQMEKEKQNDILGYSGVRGSELNSSESDACSVGSCSVTNHGLKNYNYHYRDAQCQETDTLCSEAESSYGSGSDRRSSSFSLKEEVEVSIRSLELHAYSSTLRALYASGPLSWEQEALLTNLRIMLHISNDQHLKELKHLISTKTAITLR